MNSLEPSPGLVVGFDLDMTLIDSTAGIAACLTAALNATPGGEGLVVGPAELWPWVGFPLEDTVIGLAPSLDVDTVVRSYRARYDEVAIPLLTLLPGVHETFAAVRSAGGRVLVVSAKSQPGVVSSLARVGLTGAAGPDLVVGGLFAAAKGVRLREERASVYVGDHPGDLEAARVAGAAGVAVATGPYDADALRAAGADVVLTGLPEFPDWLSAFLPGLSRSRLTG